MLSCITKNAITKARTTFCSSPLLLGLSPVGDVASAVENASAAYSGTTAAPPEYFDHTGYAGMRRAFEIVCAELTRSMQLLGISSVRELRKRGAEIRRTNMLVGDAYLPKFVF